MKSQNLDPGRRCAITGLLSLCNPRHPPCQYNAGIWDSPNRCSFPNRAGNQQGTAAFPLSGLYYVRAKKQHSFMGAFRRLNVGCGRVRFGFYFVASARTLKVGRFGYRSPAKLHKCFESYNAKVTLQAPDSVTAGVTAGDVDNVNILGTTKRAPAPLLYTPPPPALI